MVFWKGRERVISRFLSLILILEKNIFTESLIKTTMGSKDNNLREHWGGNIGFILAVAGSAIGLGNLWKFPYVTGQNGGGAFVLVYLLCVVVIGLPIVVCEIAIGRNTQKAPMGAFLKLAPRNLSDTRSMAIFLLLIACGLFCFGKIGIGLLFLILAAVVYHYGWGTIGVLGLITPFFILSYYGTVGGWTIAYFVKGLFQQLNFTDPDVANETFMNFIQGSYSPVFFQVLFILSCGLVVWFGIRNGIELASKLLLPLLFILVLVLIMRGLTLDGASKGVRFFLSPDFSKLTTGGVLTALGQAFFSLSLGMGVGLTYGSYLEQNQSILSSSLFIAVSDTLFAILAGLAIFPAVFAMGIEPNTGPGLVFVIMPMTFNAIGDHFGWLWTAIFFLLVYIAALTSGISLLEVCVACLIDQFKMKRHTAVFWTTSLIGLLGVVCTLSVNDWSRFPWLQEQFTRLFGSADESFFSLFDHFSSNYLLPLGGLGISIFVGWRWGIRHAVAELRKGDEKTLDVNFFTLLAGLKDDPLANEHPHTLTLATIWGIFVRFISPVAVVVVFLRSIGWLNF